MFTTQPKTLDLGNDVTNHESICTTPWPWRSWSKPLRTKTIESFRDQSCRHESEVKVAQSCPTLCNPMDCTVRRILQARILEWVAFPFSRGSSQPRNRTQVSCIAGGFFTSWATREAIEEDKETANHAFCQRANTFPLSHYPCKDYCLHSACQSFLPKTILNASINILYLAFLWQSAKEMMMIQAFS